MSLPCPNPDWRTPAHDECFAEGMAHVWLAVLPEGLDERDLAETLSPEEQARAARFAFERLRAEYVFHHAALRAILSGYLGLVPRGIGIRAGEHGKPLLGPPFEDWKFNLAHSGPAALIAVRRGADVGVDIERIRPLKDARMLARHYFTLREEEEVRADPLSFFTIWTRKEAVLKATGEGLHRPLASVDVTAAPGPVRVLDRWVVRDLPPVEGYTAALAVEGEWPPVATWRWGPVMAPTAGTR